MAINPPLTKLPITTATSGFYTGLNQIVSIGSKIIIGLLIVWAAAFPEQAGNVLKAVNGFLNAHFGTWYMYIIIFYMAVCLALALWPSTGRIRLGAPEDKPEFSRFSWFSMMFGAGIGIGVLTYATAEPIYHFSTNPEVITGTVKGSTPEAVRSAFKWSFLHWGFPAWGCYAMTGLALAFFSYSRGLPLTIRSALAPLFGKLLSGSVGHLVDIISVVATILGVAVTIGYGVSQFASGMFNISGAAWMMDAEGLPTISAMFVSLLIVMFAATLSALSGIGKGIKWLSNLNMGLSFFLLAFFLIFGATAFSLKSLFVGIFDSVVGLPSMMLTVWRDNGTQAGKALADWQSTWTVFYWAWWIAFSPFVGLFLARISKGRTVREFVFGATIVPSLMCFVWFAFVGGTAIDMELSGIANNTIIDAGLSSQLFATINIMLSSGLAKMMSIVIVVLLLTYLVTSADSAMLIINTIAAAGDASQNASIHIIVWGTALTGVIGVLLVAGGMDAIKTAMIIGALPFSFVMALMGVSLITAVVRDGMRNRAKSADVL